jgi:hypothetical protein
MAHRIHTVEEAVVCDEELVEEFIDRVTKWREIPGFSIRVCLLQLLAGVRKDERRRTVAVSEQVFKRLRSSEHGRRPV